MSSTQTMSQIETIKKDMARIQSYAASEQRSIDALKRQLDPHLRKMNDYSAKLAALQKKVDQLTKTLQQELAREKRR